MNDTTITGTFGTLRREQDVIEYSTWGGPVADERWRHTDKQGHEH